MSVMGRCFVFTEVFFCYTEAASALDVFSPQSGYGVFWFSCNNQVSDV